MSDGYHFHQAADAELIDATLGAPIYAREARQPRDCVAAPLVLNSLAPWLPRLGTVLWVDRREVATPTRTASANGDAVMLLKHPAACALARSGSVQAHGVVTAQGPREWLSFHDPERVLTSKLFLLPDTDCLAWDQMNSATGLRAIDCASCEPPAHDTFLRRALARFGHRWQARLLVFKYQQFPWMQSLDAHAPLRISLLGLDVARAIVKDENADWISPLHIA